MVAGGYSRPLAVKNLPEPAAVSWTIGQWIFWSNDLPVELAGEGFEHAEHVGEFPWWEGQHPYGFRSRVRIQRDMYAWRPFDTRSPPLGRGVLLQFLQTRTNRIRISLGSPISRKRLVGDGTVCVDQTKEPRRPHAPVRVTGFRT